MSVVEVSQDRGVRWLVLNRPRRRNAIDEEVVDALDDAVTQAEQDDDVRAVVLAGRGLSFCAGADLRHLLAIADLPGEPTAFLSRVSALVTRFERSPKPFVAALHGHVVAGGLEMALACDGIVAAEGTLIGDGHLRHRLLPAAGSSVRLPRKVGAGLARRLLLSGRLLPAEQFLASGWITAVVAPGSLEDAALEVALELAEVSGPGQANLKTLLADLDDLDVTRGLAHELDAFADNWTDANVQEALKAFVGDRPGVNTR